MSVFVRTKAPKQLLENIQKGIDENKIRTWEYDRDGDFTYLAEQYARQAWLTPIIQSEGVAFGIIGVKGQKMGADIYAIYHGRFIQMLLEHFDTTIQFASASALPDKNDQIG